MRIIIGAGMAGLICGSTMKGSVIYEAQDELPDNHTAVLRLKTDKVAKLTGIPFRKVNISKAIWMDGKEVSPSPRINNLYSQKVLGVISNRSIMDLSPGTRFIAPDNFRERLAEKCSIVFSFDLEYISENEMRAGSDIVDRGLTPIISTMPMPVLAQLTGTKIAHDFPVASISTTTLEIPGADAFSTIYYPDPNTSAYRASLQGSKLIIESIGELRQEDINMVIDSFGIYFSSDMEITTTAFEGSRKIKEIPSQARQQFIYQMSTQMGIYSLGRFATWRPKVMLDDLVDDIEVINRLIQNGNYAAAQHQQEQI